jgi:hypothetical protein
MRPIMSCVSLIMITSSLLQFRLKTVRAFADNVRKDRPAFAQRVSAVQASGFKSKV